MINFPREMSMATPGLFKVLPLAALNVFSAIPLNFKYQIGWQYGNWESIQFIYPGYFLVFFYALARNKKEIIFKRLYLSVFYLIIVSAILMSGIFSNIFSMIPVLKSMHVNPRWAMVVIFPLFYLAIKCCQEFELNEAWVKILLVFVFLVPLLYLDKVNLALDYPYRAGYDETNNKLGYCYEPFYGYNLEYFPVPRNTQVDFFRNKYLDPRCLLASGNCKPGTLLPDNDIDALEKYQLK
jgi:hypothetical protein